MKITEITRQGAELDTTAKIKSTFKLKLVCPIRTYESIKQDDSNADPDTMTYKKKVNRKYADKFKDVDPLIKFSKQRTGYPTEEWDYKYGKLNPDGNQKNCRFHDLT